TRESAGIGRCWQGTRATHDLNGGGPSSKEGRGHTECAASVRNKHRRKQLDMSAGRNARRGGNPMKSNAGTNVLSTFLALVLAGAGFAAAPARAQDHLKVAIGQINVGAALRAFARGAPVRILLPAFTGRGDLFWYVKADSPLKTVKDISA